ncbi:MAG TPA: hypothetical protein VLG91_03435 [Streptomyces sp.]|nr:hypothetical protein [Streptomyces sp.]
MAIKLTVYISDEDGPLSQVTGEEDPGDLNEMVDEVLNVANKHAKYYIARVGDAEAKRENWS